MSLTAKTSTIFKGATKPPMLFGVPSYVVFALFIFFGMLSFFSSWIGGLKMFGLMLIPVVLMPLLREITKRDDQMFRLLFLKYKFAWFFKSNRKGGLTRVSPRQFRNTKNV